MTTYDYDVGAGGRWGGAPGITPVLPLSVSGGSAGGRIGGAQASSVPALSQPAGLDIPMRITSWDATVGDQGISSLALTLSVPPPSKPAVPSSLYFMQAIATLQAQVAGLATGGGGGTGGGATFTVAAFNSRSLSADFVCPGFEDQVTINEALNSLPNTTSNAGGGKVLLYDGTFSTTAPILININNTTLEGFGAASQIAGQRTGSSGGAPADDYNLIEVMATAPGTQIPVGNATIRNLTLYSSASIRRHGSNLAIIAVPQTSPATEVNTITVENVQFLGSGYSQDAVYAFYAPPQTAGVDTCWFRNNNLTGTGLNGILLGDTTESWIVGNIFDSTGTCIELVGSFGSTIADNYFLTTGAPSWSLGDVTTPCIQLSASSQISITGNVMENGGPEGWPVSIINSGNIAIAGNQFSGDCATGAGILIEGNSTEIAITGNDLSEQQHAVWLTNPSNAPGINAITIEGNICNANNFTGTDQPAILVDAAGGIIRFVDIGGNAIQDTEAGFGVAGTGIRLQNGASRCHIHDNTIRQTTWGYSGTFAIDIHDSACTANFVHGNDVNGNPALFNDSGTSTIAYGNSQAPSGGGGGGVTSFNTRTGAVTLTAGDIEGTFGAAGQLFYGTGSGTGALLAATTNGFVLTLAGGLPTWAAASGGSFPPAWITFGSGNPLSTAPSAAGIFYYDTTNGGLWSSHGTATGDWYSIGGDPGGAPGSVTGVTSVTNGLTLTVGASSGSGSVIVTDSQAEAGTGNAWGWFMTGTDGQQSISAFLGSTGQFEFDWNADGSWSAPDMPATGGGSAFFNPARAPATTTITSGTGKQIDATHDRHVFVQTSTAGSVTIAVSPDNVTYYTLGTKSVTATDLLTGIPVPSGWYLKLTATGATLGTVTYY